MISWHGLGMFLRVTHIASENYKAFAIVFIKWKTPRIVYGQLADLLIYIINNVIGLILQLAYLYRDIIFRFDVVCFRSIWLIADLTTAAANMQHFPHNLHSTLNSDMFLHHNTGDRQKLQQRVWYFKTYGYYKFSKIHITCK